MAVPRPRLHKSAQLRGSSKDSRYLQQNHTEFRHKVSETLFQKTIGLGLSVSVAVWAPTAVFVWINSLKVDLKFVSNGKGKRDQRHSRCTRRQTLVQSLNEQAEPA